MLTFLLPLLTPFADLLAAPFVAIADPCSRSRLQSACGGVDGVVQALAEWDPDGAGPRNPQIVVAGTFAKANGVPAGNIACWDTVTGEWSVFGTGTNGSVFAVAVLPNGFLVAAGRFTIAGGQPRENIAVWNGATWGGLGAGLHGTSVGALAVRPNGELIAGGAFLSSGTTLLASIARWDGTAWLPLGAGTGSSVLCMCVAANGDLLAGGGFVAVNGVPTRVARWNGSSWAAIGSGQIGDVGGVRSVVELPGGEIVISGSLQLSGSSVVEPTLSWNGSVWASMRRGVGTYGGALEYSGGDLYLGARPTAFTSTMCRRVGGAWQQLGGTFADAGYGSILAILGTANGRLFCGGTFHTVDAVPLVGFAEWAGEWGEPVGGSCGQRWETDPAVLGNFTVDAPAKKMAVLQNGDLVVAGSFTTAGAPPVAAPRVARWDGTGWHAIGPTLPTTVLALHVDTNGSLLAGGVGMLVRWTGTAWQNVITPYSTTLCTSIATLPNGDLVAVGRFVPPAPASEATALRITPTGITTFPASVTGFDTRAVVSLPNGSFAVAGAGVAMWNGSSWTTLASSPTTVTYLGVLSNGQILAGGPFSSIGGITTNGIAVWNGSTWQGLGSGLSGCVSDVEELPNGDLLVVGQFGSAGGVAVNNVARWDGVRWHALGTGVDDKAMCLVKLPSGDIAVGGAFTAVNCAATPRLALLRAGCPASAIARGAGCPSSGGANTLAAVTLPWVNELFTASATGVPQTAIALTVTGLSTLLPPLPLAIAFPEAMPNCNLRVAPDILGLASCVGGVAQSQFFLPDTPSIAGVTFWHQLLPFEFDAAGSLVAITVTNALQLTAGMR